MSLQFSFIKCEERTLNTINSPDTEIGLYTNNIINKSNPKHIKPISTEYMKHFYAKTHNPSYTRLGNNTEPDILC